MISAKVFVALCSLISKYKTGPAHPREGLPFIVQFTPGNVGPAVEIPAQRQDGQHGLTVPEAIVKMAAEPVGALFRINAGLAGTDEWPARAQKRAAPTGN